MNLQRKVVATRQQQTGATLLYGVIILVILTLIGLASVRSVTLQEQMSANVYDRELAFQAAETALLAGEAAIEAGTITATTAWLTATNSNLGALNSDPQYQVEYLGNSFPCSSISDCAAGTDCNCRRFRVNARSANGASRANVTLQSIYAIP